MTASVKGAGAISAKLSALLGSAIAAFGGPGGGASNAGRMISLIVTKQW